VSNRVGNDEPPDRTVTGTANLPGNRDPDGYEIEIWFE
jgi:hypothetical protein